MESRNPRPQRKLIIDIHTTDRQRRRLGQGGRYLPRRFADNNRPSNRRMPAANERSTLERTLQSRQCFPGCESLYLTLHRGSGTIRFPMEQYACANQGLRPEKNFPEIRQSAEQVARFKGLFTNSSPGKMSFSSDWQVSTRKISGRKDPGSIRSGR